MLPCANDLRFISDNSEIMREAAKECGACPVAFECFELRAGTREGVAGGYLPRDAVRRAIRRENDSSANCPAGHPKDLYETVIVLEGGPKVSQDEDRPYQPPQTIVCTQCAYLLQRLLDIADAS